jgi:glutamyl-tRNA synthetase
MTVRVRFAPSPTGYPHIGNIRTVVFNWLFARQQNGQFILRIEDTDQSRYVEGATDVILESLEWLNLDYDEGPIIGGDYGPYVQSERLSIYKAKAEELVRMGKAYRCNCSPERLDTVRAKLRADGKNPMYDGLCRIKKPGEVSVHEPHVIRLKVARQGQTTFHDLLRGEISIENNLLDDQILLKSDGFPTYHLAVVVDDHMMGITHVMRGDDWISSTPKRILLYQAFGWTPPIFIHVPLVCGADGKKLGKRHGAVSIDEFRRLGYLPEALVNFLALLGWAPGEGTDQEIFTREELISLFDINRINLSAGVFSYEKLNWMNGCYIRALDEYTLLERLLPFWIEAGYVEEPVSEVDMQKLRVLVPLVQERLKTLRDVLELTDFVFTEIEDPPVESLIGKKMTAEQSLDVLIAVENLFKTLTPFTGEAMEGPLRQLVSDLGLKVGQVFTIIRNCVTNKRVTPPLFGSLHALGKDKTLARIARGKMILESRLQQT